GDLRQAAALSRKAPPPRPDRFCVVHRSRRLGGLRTRRCRIRDGICAEAGFGAPFDAAAAAGARVVVFAAAPGLHGRRTSQTPRPTNPPQLVGRARRASLWAITELLGSPSGRL